MKTFLQGARELSPYLLVELLLPGGTVIALLLWIYRNQSKVITLLVTRFNYRGIWSTTRLSLGK